MAAAGLQMPLNKIKSAEGGSAPAGRKLITADAGGVGVDDAASGGGDPEEAKSAMELVARYEIKLTTGLMQMQRVEAPATACKTGAAKNPERTGPGVSVPKGATPLLSIGDTTPVAKALRTAAR